MLLGTKWSENVNGLNVAVINPSDKKMAADSMRKSFYSAAAVPVALGLDNRDDPEVTSMVDREIDVFVNSGFSCVVRNNVNGEVSGGAFFAYFARNEDYCVIEGASMADWHNAAAEIAMGVRPEKPQLIWREYQYQHVYNACQVRMAATGAEFAVYYAIIYLAPEARDSGVSDMLTSAVERATLKQNGTTLVLATVDAFTAKAKEMFSKPVVLERAAYEDQKLSIGGVPLFGKLAKFGGITVLSSNRR